jgi:hypothetical protein
MLADGNFFFSDYHFFFSQFLAECFRMFRDHTELSRCSVQQLYYSRVGATNSFSTASWKPVNTPFSERL